MKTTPAIHLISGLPRSGSTLLSGILRQNPRFHAAISTPLAGMLTNQVKCMSHHEAAPFITDAQREGMLKATVDAYYAAMADKGVIFDTNRSWCAMLPLVARILPEARVICMVRSPAWIVDSIERLVQRNALLASKMFGGKEDLGNVYSRFEMLLKNGLLGNAMKALRQAWYGEHAGRIIAIRYDSLVRKPAETIEHLYTLLGQEPFRHDFDNVEYSEPEFDFRLNTPGLHNVSGKVEMRERQSILPPELFKQNHVEFWNLDGQNPRSVQLI